jgi:HAE1 family hydrophobic/amphiphilic exporter-1
MDQLVELSGIARELADSTGAEWVSARIGVRAEEGVDALLTALYSSPRMASSAIPYIRDGWTGTLNFPMTVEKRESLLGQILGGGSGFTVFLEGENLDVDLMAAEALSATIESEIPSVESADVEYLPGKPEILLRLDTELLSLIDVDATEIADYLESLSRGYPATTFYRQDERVDVMLLTGEGEGIPLSEVFRRSLPTTVGLVSLDRLLQPERRHTPGFIEHYQGNRAVALSIQGGGSNLAGLAEDIDAVADSLLEGAPVKLRTGSEIEEMERTASGLILAGLLAVGLVYVLLAVQFESFREPFVIMFTVPLGVIGVVAGLILFGQSWNALSGIGLVVLCGIVVNDGILLVERIGQLRRGGMAMEPAIIQAGKDRFRPVIMTTVTTALGLLPMAIGFGVGASLRQPLAIAVISGILVATALTLVVVPLLYRVLSRRDRVAGAE